MPTSFDPHIAALDIERVSGAGRELICDELAVEEPLEIRVDGAALAVTMRTPGDDEELAAGFLVGEGLIHGPDDIVSVGLTEDLARNVVEVSTRAGLRRDPADERRFYLTSSCGVCGKGALEFVRQEARPPPHGAPVEPRDVFDAPAIARRAQRAFARTGGLHATGLFAPAGELLVLREDVGRHNAMDKAVGSLLLAGALPPVGTVGCLSGRASFELVQKAAWPGWPGSSRWALPPAWPSSWPASSTCCSAASSGTTPSTSTRERSAWPPPELVNSGPQMGMHSFVTDYGPERAVEAAFRGEEVARTRLHIEVEDSTGDSLQLFLRDIARRRLLTAAEEVDLAKQIERGNQAAKDRMIESNLRLVVSNAKRYRGLGLPFSTSSRRACSA